MLSQARSLTVAYAPVAVEGDEPVADAPEDDVQAILGRPGLLQQRPLAAGRLPAETIHLQAGVDAGQQSRAPNGLTR